MTTPFRPANYPCPDCGQPPKGVIDTLVVEWMLDEEGRLIDWYGNDLDTQEGLYEKGLPVLCCPNGHDYTHPDVKEQPEPYYGEKKDHNA